MKKREEIKDCYKWKTSDIYESVADWEKGYEKLSSMSDLTRFQGKLADDKVLLEYLKASEEATLLFGFLEVYAMMRKDEDSSRGEFVTLQYKINKLATEYSYKNSFAITEINAFSDDKLNGLIKNPIFADYNRLFEQVLKEKPHTLSTEGEELLALGGQVFSSFRQIFTMLDNVDFPFPEVDYKGERVTVSHGMYGVLLKDTDRAVREKVFKEYYASYKSLLNVISTIYISSVQKNVFLAKARKYTSAMNRALCGEEVSDKVYNTLLSSVEKALPIMHEYVAERKRVLGYEELHMYDMYVSLVDDCGIERSYEQAFEMVKSGLAILGENYQNLWQKAFDQGWIDVEENFGKRSGAYSVGVYGLKHPYVLLNYQKTVHDIFTIAHELGHALHTHFSNENQPQSKADYTIFVAEVASTVNEVLLLKSLLAKETDKKVRKYLLNYFLEMIRTTLFRQTMFAEFEYIAHTTAEKDSLSKDYLNEEYLKLNKKYYGDAVISDEEISYEWARIPHFYSAFYVYKYATGIISAITIADKILNKEDGAVENYLKFLSSGSSKTPVELLKIAGVDLETKEPYDKAMKVFKDTLEEFIGEN